MDKLEYLFFGEENQKRNDLICYGIVAFMVLYMVGQVIRANFF